MPTSIQFQPPPRLTGVAGQDNAALIEWIWQFFNAAITNQGLVQSSELSSELQSQFPTLYSLGVLTGTGADLIAYFTAPNTMALTAFTDDARLLLAKDSVADMVTFLGVSTLTTEQVQDLVAALIPNGTGISWTYDDGANTLTANVTITQYTDELAQDAVGAMVDASLTYVDATPLLQRAALTGDVTAAAGSNALTLVATAGVIEIIQDVIGALLVDSTSLDVTYNDAGNSFTISVIPGGGNVGYLNIPQNTQDATYTTVLADAGKHIYHTSGSAHTWTIDSNANVAYTTGAALTFVNYGAGVVTIAIASDTLVLAGTGSTGSRSLAQYGTATALKINSTTWIISGTGLT